MLPFAGPKGPAPDERSPMSAMRLPALFAVLALVGCACPVQAAQDAPRAKPAAPAAKNQPPVMLPRTKGKLKPVDINSATKEEISFMLGIDVGLAAKIVAGRPYLTKSRLVTEKIVSDQVYASIKDKVVARQSADSPAGKPSPVKK